MKIISSIVLFLILTSNSLASEKTYEAILKGKKCTENKNQNISCSYKVGKSLFIEIAGIGTSETGIAFLKSDYDGDYYGKYGMLHGCVIVNNTKNILSFAFISPKNGEVYKTWQECKSGV